MGQVHATNGRPFLLAHSVETAGGREERESLQGADEGLCVHGRSDLSKQEFIIQLSTTYIFALDLSKIEPSVAL